MKYNKNSEVVKSRKTIVRRKEDLKQDFFQKNSILVEKYLSGKRDNPMICTNHKIAKQIEKKYHIKMIVKEVVNEEKGLYMFEIQ